MHGIDPTTRPGTLYIVAGAWRSPPRGGWAARGLAFQSVARRAGAVGPGVILSELAPMSRVLFVPAEPWTPRLDSGFRAARSGASRFPDQGLETERPSGHDSSVCA